MINSKKYYIDGKDENRIRRLFQTKIINLFEQNDGITLEANGNSILYFKDYKLAFPEQLRRYIDQGIEVAQLLKNI